MKDSALSPVLHRRWSPGSVSLVAQSHQQTTFQTSALMGTLTSTTSCEHLSSQPIGWLPCQSWLLSRPYSHLFPWTPRVAGFLSGPVLQQGPLLMPGPRLCCVSQSLIRTGEAAETWCQAMDIYLRVTLALDSPTAPYLLALSWLMLLCVCCNHSPMSPSQEVLHQSNVPSVSFLLRVWFFQSLWGVSCSSVNLQSPHLSVPFFT